MKPKILLLADTGHHTGAVQDHIRAVTADLAYDWVIENPLVCKLLHKLDLNTFAGIGIHYSIKPYSSYYLPKPLAQAISQFPKFKFIFLQDEFRCVNKNIHAILSLKIQTLFTLVEPRYYAKAYAALQPQVELITVLTGYVGNNLLNLPYNPIAQRTIDIFYRSRRYPYWLGRLAQERLNIAEYVNQHAAQSQLCVDISLDEQARIYGAAWLNRLANAKAVLGTESGASVWDPAGQVEQSVKLFLAKNPKADFDTVHDKILAPYENNPPYAAISPRVFEAAATRTAMILFPGSYSGVLKAEQHYIPLAKDFSNFNDVVAKLKDNLYLEQLVQRTYHELISTDLYHQHQLGRLVATVISKHITKPDTRWPVAKATPSLLNARHKSLNALLCLNAELRFMAGNFLQLLRDPSYRGFKKFNLLLTGFKRYLSYVTSRFKSRTELQND